MAAKPLTLVVKVCDVDAALNAEEKAQLKSLMQKVDAHRLYSGKAPLDCVVVDLECSDPHNQGFDAFLEHGDDAINPYPDQTEEHFDWGAGFSAAQSYVYSEVE